MARSLSNRIQIKEGGYIMRVSTNWKEVEYKQIVLDDDKVV